MQFLSAWWTYLPTFKQGQVSKKMENPQRALKTSGSLLYSDRPLSKQAIPMSCAQRPSGCSLLTCHCQLQQGLLWIQGHPDTSDLGISLPPLPSTLPFVSFLFLSRISLPAPSLPSLMCLPVCTSPSRAAFCSPLPLPQQTSYTRPAVWHTTRLKALHP